MNSHSHYWQKIPRIAVWLFVLGLIGGVALRLTIFLQPFDETLMESVWYTGVIAYTIFYFVRISIENHRREICNEELMSRLHDNQLTAEDRAELHDLLSSLCRSKVKYNYAVWLAISVISLMAAIFFT